MICRKGRRPERGCVAYEPDMVRVLRKDGGPRMQCRFGRPGVRKEVWEGRSRHECVCVVGRGEPASDGVIKDVL